MENPWLSAVMPCRNGERWLAVALQSIVDQGETGIEVVFIDGSTTEASVRIAESFAGKLNIRIEHSPNLQSWMEKTNHGVLEASAEWVCMLHTDDFWLPSRCGFVRRWIAKHLDAVMHLHPTYIVGPRGKKRGVWRCP